MTFLSAEEARALAPQFDLAATLQRIDRLVRKVAPNYEHVRLPGDLLPGTSIGSWACGRLDKFSTPVEAALKKAGYTIDTDPGGHSGPGGIFIRWGSK